MRAASFENDRGLSASSLGTPRHLKSLEANSYAAMFSLEKVLFTRGNWYGDLTFVSGMFPVGAPSGVREGEGGIFTSLELLLGASRLSFFNAAYSWIVQARESLP